jgi:hypothetical protein
MIVPKKREDLLVEEFRVDQAVRNGRADATPVFTTERNWRSRRISVLILWTPLRLRLQPVSTTAREEYIKRHGVWRNRTTISPCVLNPIWLPVKPVAPDWEQIMKMDKDELRNYFIYKNRSEWLRRVYQVVMDLPTALRQPGHVMTAYDQEKARLTQRQSEIQTKLVDGLRGTTALSSEERHQLNEESFTIGRRRQEIDQIYQDRLLRELRLKDLVLESSSQLVSLGESLSQYGERITRPQGPKPSWITADLGDYLTRLVFWNTAEVRPLIRVARQEIQALCKDIYVYSPPEACQKLQHAGEKVREAGIILKNAWEAT